MANQDYTHIVLVVDKSGSMESRVDGTISGVHDYLKEQDGSGRVTVSAVLFDERVEEPWTLKELDQVKGKFRDIYWLGGYTALLDAIGHTIESTVRQINAMREWEKPGRVVVVIITDGHENASRRYCGTDGKSRIASMIKHHEDHENWDFIFMGAGIDAFGAGEEMGIRQGKTVSFSGDPAKQREAWLAAASATKAARSGQLDADADFFGEQWRKRIK